MRDPELVARAQRAATRLESAWEQWRTLHGLADAPGQPVVSYVGYSLKEPWGEPRVVIGIDADEAEYLAEFLDRDECVQRGQVPVQQAPVQPSPFQQSPLQQAPLHQAPLHQAPVQPGAVQQSPPLQQAQLQPPSLSPGQLQPVPLQAGPLQSGPLQQARDIAAELAGWNQGEVPGQLPEQFASWPPGGPLAADQPPASA